MAPNIAREIIGSAVAAKGFHWLPFISTNQDAGGVVILGPEKTAIVAVSGLELQSYSSCEDFLNLVTPRIETALKAVQ